MHLLNTRYRLEFGSTNFTTGWKRNKKDSKDEDDSNATRSSKEEHGTCALLYKLERGQVFKR